MFAQPSRTAAAGVLRIPYICRSCLRRASAQSLTRETVLPVLQHRTLQTSLPEAKDNAPFRKLLKDEAKKKRQQEKATSSSKKSSKPKSDPWLEKWELTVGIEIHAELNTSRKLFSSAATSVNEAPNTHVALFDLAVPGSQPQFQKETLIPALRAALALGCEVQWKSTFDRKHYFYQDQPNGYQITQYYEPFAKNGSITLYPHDFPGGVSPENGPVTIGIKQVQMEQDTAKTIQQPPHTHLLDFNRVSHPLIEIITLPQIHHPTTAAVLVKKIQAVLKAVDSVTAGMEMGGLRADVNVSVRQRDSASGKHSYSGISGLGQRTEIKNLASVKAVEEAIIAERDRQIELLESGGVVEGETRGWTLGSKTTKRLRGKEGEIDYRYMPDPDIAPVVVGEDVIQHLNRTLPPLSDEWMKTLTESPEYGLTSKDASTLITLDDGERLDYYLDIVHTLRSTFKSDPEILQRVGKAAGNWVLMDLGGLFKNETWDPERVAPEKLSSILTHLLRKQITGRTAKLLLAILFNDPHNPQTVEEIIKEKDMLLKPLSHDEYVELAKKLLEEKSDMVKDILEKKQMHKIKWFVGQMMGRAAEGAVEPGEAERVLRVLLDLPES
ncbi:aspartyl/glutamyl-tRNA amidotransferase subunit B [Delitschia confertaspora ATCC 74209]|uniref:Glutamyl-tRNA(Gln) amidotransferase subunit B, mitochondrial n=1 Tax=Delitschia confertaspora ATCC 74209 TaxID=1513339 RepID=A0A9P4JM86_9PLEO|nr:aspartyl/glutamyl-tRNA amidotransferase subunit B [Delitschia confertaspora ATCC 74209]